MADAIKEEFGIAPVLIQGSGGVFDVRLDGKLIYSKKETGRFPEHHEVLNKIAAVAP